MILAAPADVAELIELQGGEDRLFVVEPGVLDNRALGAFVGGQCHGLALALHRRTGWPLVAIDDRQGVCEHIVVRKDDGQLVDVTGAHSPEQMISGSGRQLRDIGEADIGDLTSNHGWAPADEESSEAWVDAVLQRAKTESDSEAMPAAVLQQTGPIGNTEVRIRWTSGQATMEVHARPAGLADGWTPVGHIAVPRIDGRRVIDFTTERLMEITGAWAATCDPAEIERKLRG